MCISVNDRGGITSRICLYFVGVIPTEGGTSGDGSPLLLIFEFRPSDGSPDTSGLGRPSEI